MTGTFIIMLMGREQEGSLRAGPHPYPKHPHSLQSTELIDHKQRGVHPSAFCHLLAYPHLPTPSPLPTSSSNRSPRPRIHPFPLGEKEEEGRMSCT